MTTQRIGFFDTWQPGYGGESVSIYVAGTTTLASVYTDEALSTAASNPQTLQTLDDDGILYGKWAAPLYTSQSVELSIDGVNTGIIRPPLTTLDGQDASNATVIATGGSQAVNLEDHLARVVYAEDYGAIGATAATNNTTITAAIGAAAALGGGYVILPDGTIPFTGLTLSAGVRLRGQGRDVTILQCETLDNCTTISGDKAGLECLTLDGVDLGAGSVGVYSKANDETVFSDVLVKRFETGLHFKGGRRANWRDLNIDNCDTGAKLHGDTDAGNGADGDAYRNNIWTGGQVTNCTTKGVELSYEDALCQGNVFNLVHFEDNTGTAININGARNTRFLDGSAFGNTTLLAVADDSDTTAVDSNTVIGLHFIGGTYEDGAATFTGTCQDVIFEKVEIKDVDFTLTTVDNQILVLDSIEDSDVTISGDATKYGRRRAIEHVEVSGVTTDNVATTIWSFEMVPGALVLARAHIVGRGRNVAQRGAYDIEYGAYRPGSSLAYDAQTGNFTAGLTVTGGTSGATARIQADSDSGTTGTLTLTDIATGPTGQSFIDNEALTDTSTGAATANGTLTGQNVAADSVGGVALRTAYETNVNWAAAFPVDTSAQTVKLQVTGDTSQTVEWVAQIDIVEIG